MRCPVGQRSLMSPISLLHCASPAPPHSVNINSPSDRRSIQSVRTFCPLMPNALMHNYPLMPFVWTDQVFRARQPCNSASAAPPWRTLQISGAAQSAIAVARGGGLGWGGDVGEFSWACRTAPLPGGVTEAGNPGVSGATGVGRPCLGRVNED